MVRKILLILSLSIAIILVIFTRAYQKAEAPQIPNITKVATSTELFTEDQKNESTTTTATKIIPKPKIETSKPPTINPSTPAPAPTPTPSPIANEPAPDFEAINTFARKATVNILCTTKNSEMSPISGTGIIISKDGLILTNAHVAQYFLLRDLYTKNFIECVVRTGNPAYPKYNAELVYISPEWVEKNASNIKLSSPLGTGEHDYALLRITKAIDNGDISSLPYMQVNTSEENKINEPVVLVSYPAGFLGGQTIIQNLGLASAITSIQDVFTFSENLIDIISVGGTIVSQKGASGGGVIDKNYSLVGIISTSSNGSTTSSRSLNAITLSYIDRDLKSKTNLSIADYISGDKVALAKNFQENVAPDLTKLLTNEITKI